MAEETSGPVVLAIAREPRARRGLTALLTPDFGVIELEPASLLDPVRLLDAAAAVVLLDAEDDESGLDCLRALESLPAGRSLVLLLEGTGEELAEAALTDLAPQQVLGAPVAGAALRYALRRTLPSVAPGRGARIHQRRTPALLGVSGAIRELIEQVKQIASASIPVLILGETGTGKELVARAIHDQSPRAERPFVAVNCGALPDSLLESELFGHTKGAFTGADRDKRGLFEHADGGTIFLDEIGDTSPALQLKLLRVLEQKEIRPVGGTRTTKVDVRVVSATQRDLESAIEDGSFRQDLFYRLNAVSLYVPPLRRRRVDIPFLAQHFAEELGAGHARRITLHEDFLESLSQREFPGNVRELRNEVERAITLAERGGPVTGDPRDRGRGDGNAKAHGIDGTLREIVNRLETETIRATLERLDGNVRLAADALGLSRPGLRYKMRRLGLED